MDLEDESKLSESEDCGEPAENTMGDDSANTEEQGSQDEENSREQEDSSSSQEETGSNDEDTLSHPSHGSKAIADEQGTRNQGGEMPYHCSKCDIRFADVAYLERHNKSVHNGGQGFNCCVCNKEFKRNKNLKAHMKIHTSERPFSCSQCDKQFIDVHGLSKHEKTHDTQRSFNCCICGKQYKNSDGLKKHLNSHTRQNLYGCSVCNKQFTLKDSLQGHMKLHADEKQFTCPHCEKTFTKRDNMKRHMRVHTGEMPYSCTECNKLFRCTSNLYRHMKTHADVKPVAYNKSYEEIQPRDEAPSPVFTICRDLENPELFNCDQCNKKFSLDIDLIRHWQEVHSGNSKPYVCFECLRRFRYSRSLSIHLKRSHYKENPSAIRLDMKCLKTRPVESFSENRVKDEDGGSKSTGNYSVEIYDGEIPFSCQQCTKQFKDMPALNAHMSVHSEEKLFRYRPIGGRQEDEKGISSDCNREEVRNSVDSFNCFVCSQRYNNKEHLKAHMIIHTGGKPFNCNECNQQFNDAQSLSKHKMTHAAPVTSKFSCHFCDKKCTDYEDLVEHLNFHITQTLSGQTVQNSGVAVQNKSGKPVANSNSSGKNLSNHSTPSSNTRASSANQSGKTVSSSNQSSCCICNKQFTLRSSLAMHMKIHTGEKQFSCSHCDRTFTKRDNMKRHMRVHTGEMPYSCSHCDKLFRCSSNLYRHLRSHTKDGSSQRSQSDGGEASSSADSKPVVTNNSKGSTKNKFCCDQCNKSFSREKDLKKHRKIHKGSFECQFCSRQFHDSQAYSRHVKRHGESESMISCGFCNRQFLRADSLKSHMKLHTGENLYGCTLCDRTFTVKGSLEMHMKIHSGEKSFSCSQCDKKFLRKNSLNQHMRTHTGEMPYCCSLCKMRFRHSSHLHRHIKKKHSEGELAKFSQNNEPIQSVDELKTAFALIAMSYNEENLNICDEEFMHGGKRNSRGYVKKPYVCFECRRCYAESDNLVEHVNKNHFCDARYDIVATPDKDPETGYDSNPAADKNLEFNSESDVGSGAMSDDESDPKLSEKRKKLEKKMPTRSAEHSKEKLENGVEEKEKENCDCIFCTKPFQES